jgi:hypothetical protein
MVATLAGLGALLFGLALLLLPLLATELSRPGDSAWGALVLVLALVLVTSAERLSGSPMLAVICGGLLIGRLTVEVGRGRWRQLSPEEQGRLGTRERWSSSLSQASLALQGLMAAAGRQGSSLLDRWREQRQPKASGTSKAGGKRWVRPEAVPADTSAPEVIEVSDFLEIDALLQAAPPEVVAPEVAVPEVAPSEVPPAAPAAGELPAAEDPTAAAAAPAPLAAAAPLAAEEGREDEAGAADEAGTDGKRSGDGEGGGAG